MRAVQVAGWTQLPEVVEAPAPTRGPREVLVEITHYLIGASDLSFTRGDHYEGTNPAFRFPHIPGFRAAGVIAEASESGRLNVGDRVVVNGFMGCGSCEWCDRSAENHCLNRSLMGVSSGHAGGAADYLAAPDHQCHVIPEELDTVASLLCSDASLLLHAYRRAELRIGESVVVVGAGRVGALAISMAKASGASPIYAVDPSPASRDRALTLGATHAAAELAEIAGLLADLDDGGADVVIECVGSEEAIRASIAAGRPGARTILLGVLGPTRFAPDYYRDVINKENQVLSTFGKTNHEFELTLRMMGDNLIPLEPLLPSVVRIEEFERGWQAALDGTEARVAIMMNPAPLAKGASA